MKTLKIALLSLVALPGAALAAGFAVDTQSGRATGMAAAVAALSDDPSAAFYNPAGLLGGKGLELALGDTLLLPSIDVVGPSGDTTSTSGMSPPPHLYARYQITDGLAAGVGAFVPFGASSSWPEGWEGRYRTTGSSLNVYVINPELAYQVHERFKVGAGVQVARATVLLTRALGFVDSDGEVQLGGATWATGFNVGAQVQIVPDVVDLGVSWRSSIKLDVNGKANFVNVPDEFASRLVDQPVSTSVELPDMVYAGFGVRPMDGLRLGLDMHYFRWSSFPSLDFDFENDELNSTTPKQWRDTLSFHVGGEYEVTKEIAVRAGLAYDPTPSPNDTLTPDLPDFNRFKVALGGGYKLDSLQFDLAYQLVMLTETQSTSPMYPATYSGTAHVVGLTVGWQLPL